MTCFNFMSPGKNSLSCTMPHFTPATFAAEASSNASSKLGVSGFSQYTCFPAAIAACTLGFRKFVACASK
jgi:hypothetical protein